VAMLLRGVGMALPFVILIAGGLYTYYVFSQHRWSPPPAVAWQATLHSEIASNQQTVAQLQAIKQQGGLRGGFNIDEGIARAQQGIADDQYLLDNNIAPLQSFSLTLAALFGLGGIFMFLLIRIFGWLASEQIAGERSDRTIAILLSRPMSRDQLLLAKAVASFLISLAVVLVTFLVIYAMLAFILGSLYAVTVYWLGGGLLYGATRRLGSEGGWRRSRQVLALAATPLAISLLTFWPVRIAVYGQDLFRTGGDDYGRGDAIFGGVYLSIVAWSVWLLLVGVRTVHGWTWPRAAAAVALAAAFPALIVVATSL